MQQVTGITSLSVALVLALALVVALAPAVAVAQWYSTKLIISRLRDGVPPLLLALLEKNAKKNFVENGKLFNFRIFYLFFL